MSDYSYAKYRRIVVALFAHLSLEFRPDLKADLERAKQVAEKEAQATETALRKELSGIQANAQTELSAVKQTLPSLILSDFLEQSLEQCPPTAVNCDKRTSITTV